MTTRLQYFKALDGSHAADIARLEARLHPPAGRQGETAIRTLLSDPARRDDSLSFGLFRGWKPVGYLLATLEDRSLHHGGPERVVHLRDVAVLPAYRRRVRDLVLKLAQVLSAYCPGCPLEARVASDNLRRLRTFRGFALHMGYALLDDAAGTASTDPASPRVLRWEMPARADWIPDLPLPLPRRVWPHRVGDRHLEILHITEPRRWLSLKPMWNALLRETEDYTVFQSFEHLWTWWKYLALNGALNLLAIREQGKIIGIAPLGIFPERIRGGLVRDLELIGSPWQVDRAQFLFAREQEACLDATLAWIFGHRDRWDIFRLHEQRADFPITREIRERLAAAKCMVAERDWLCPYIQVEGDWQQYIAERPRKLRKNLNRSLRLLEEEGPVVLETLDSWPALDAGLAAYVAIEKESWKPEKGIDVGRSKAYFEFYRELAQIFGHTGGFQLRFLKVGNKRVAGTFGLEYDGVFYSIMIAHDRAYDRGSPGTLLEAMELEHCFKAKIHQYDFLGGFLNNKLRWTANARETVNLACFQRRPLLVYDYSMRFHIRPKLREWLENSELLPLARRWSAQIKGLKGRLLPRAARSPAKP